MGRASNTDIYKTTIAAVEEAAMVIVATQEEIMNNQVPKYVTQARASFLLGIPEASRSSGSLLSLLSYSRSFQDAISMLLSISNSEPAPIFDVKVLV